MSSPPANPNPTLTLTLTLTPHPNPNQECRAELTACFRVGVRLESWLNTYTPPLASGGNVGVSGEVAAA